MAETGQTRITSFGGNPTTYNNNSARILKGRDVTILRPEGGIEHRMYDDGTMTRVDNRTGEFIPVPEEYDAYWRNAFEQAQMNVRPNLLQRGVHWVGRGIEKAGNWLQRFEDGGTTQQVASPEQDVMNTIDAAIGEIQNKRPGQAVQKLAAMMQDPNYSMIIDMIKQEYPQIEGVLNTVEQMVGAFKCGGKTKKKVKKGAKGCVPCKKLMRVGGKLINVLTDCEGNIISKHQTGGWLIPKGEDGMLTQRRNALLNTGHTKDWLTQQEGITKTGVGKKYYQSADGFIYSIEGTANGWGPATKLGRYMRSKPGGAYQLTDEEGNLVEGGHSFDASSMISAIDATNSEKAYTSAGNTQQYYDPITKKWYNATYNMQTKAWDTTGEASHENFGDDDLYAGGNWQSGTITREGATAAGIDSSKFNIEAPTVRGVRGKGGNSLFGEAATGPTSQDYIDQYGFQGALNNEGRLRRSRLLEAKQDRRAASRAALKNGLFGQGQLRAINQEWKDTRDEIKSQHKAQTAALINAYTGRSHSTVGTPNLTTGSMTHTPASTTQSTPAKKEEYTIMQKQGGWLNKFN